MAEPQSTRIGEINSHKQKVILKVSARAGGMRGQRVYVLQCQRAGCGHEYGEEGIRLHDRKCPACQDGKRGLPVPNAAPTLF